MIMTVPKNYQQQLRHKNGSESWSPESESFYGVLITIPSDTFLLNPLPLGRSLFDLPNLNLQNTDTERNSDRISAGFVYNRKLFSPYTVLKRVREKYSLPKTPRGSLGPKYVTRIEIRTKTGTLRLVVLVTC